MPYRLTPNLDYPIQNFKVNSYKFKQNCIYNGVNWGIHLGVDINLNTNTKIKCIGRGKVVYSRLHKGSSDHPNWGNIIIIAHKNPKTKKVFFSLYAHLNKKLVKYGQNIEIGDVIGTIAPKNTPKNGFWPDSHLHFAIYIGKWHKKVLPGYYKNNNSQTNISDWQNPIPFIKNY